MNVCPVVDKVISLPARLYAFHASTCFRAPRPLKRVGGWLDIHFNHDKPNTAAPTTLEMPSNHEPGRTPTTSRRRRRKPMKQYLHNVLTPWNTKHTKVCHMDGRKDGPADRQTLRFNCFPKFVKSSYAGEIVMMTMKLQRKWRQY